MTLPYVSCICPTYNRPPEHQHLLEEAVESFYRQDYPVEKRCLIVVNDCPDQEIVLSGEIVNSIQDDLLPGNSGRVDHYQSDKGDVIVLNCRERFGSLGMKYNVGADWFCLRNDVLVMPWEDDDISLPFRISQAVERISKAHYWNPQRTWFLVGNKELHWEHSHGVCHNASIFTKEAWRRVGGYPNVSGAQDAIMDSKLKALGPVPPPLPDDPAAWAFIYRWGVSPVHLSGKMPHDEFYAEVGRMPVKPGRYELRPHWEKDYCEMVEGALSKMTGPR